MSQPKLDWSTAEVTDSKLTVQVAGELPEGWKGTFNATVQLLGGGSWGEITLKKHTAQVAGLTPGTEEKLKHFLESVVQQANASHHTEEEDQEDEDRESDDEAEDDSERESDSDRDMSERFRAFAGGDRSTGGDSKDKADKG
jgi:hypothetical protein